MNKKLFLLLLLFVFVNPIFSQIQQRGIETSAAKYIDNNGGPNAFIDINKPSGVQVGDIMLVTIAQQDNNNETETESDGWISIVNNDIEGGGRHAWGTVMYKIVTTADLSTSNYRFQIGRGANHVVGTIVAFSGVDTSNPLDAIGVLNRNNNDNNVTTNAITTVTPNTAVLIFGMSKKDLTFSNWQTTTLGSLTEIFDNQGSGDASVGLAWAIKPTLGTTGVGSVRLSENNDKTGVILLALRPCATPSVPTNTRSDNVNWCTSTIRWDGSATSFFLDVATTNTFSAGTILSSYNNLNVGNVNSLVLSGLSPNTTYHFRVRASNSCGVSTNSNAHSFTTRTIAAPTANSGYVSCNDWVAQWNGVYNTSGQEADGYFLDVAIDNTFTNYVTGYQNRPVGKTLSHTITGLAPGGLYYYRVRANTTCGTGGNSNVISFILTGNGSSTPGTIGGGTASICSGSNTTFTISGSNPSTGGQWSIFNQTGSATITQAGLVTGVSAGTVRVIFTTQNGVCRTSTSSNLTITAGATVSAASSTPTICANLALTPITHTTIGFSGISNGGVSGANGLPAGVSAVFASNTITISGTPTAIGTFNYSIPLTGGSCGSANATGTIIVTPQPTAANAGPDQSLANATSFTLAANIPTVGTGVWTIMSGPSTASSQFGNTTIPGTTFTPATPGTYVLNWAISNSCGSSSDQVVIANNCVTNLIINGNFSAGTAGWTTSTTQGSTVEVNPENTYFSNNNTGPTAELDSQASLRQVLTLIPGVSYTVSFLYARRLNSSTPTTTGVTVKVTGGTSDIVSTGFTSTNSTAQIATFTFTATNASIGLEFYNTLSGSSTYGTIIDDVVLLPASQVAPTAVTNPRGNFNTSSSCAGVPVSLDVVNVPSSVVSYSWTGTAGAVFSATNIRNPTVTFTGSGLQQATVTVTPAGGCSVTSTTYVNVAAAPVITAPLATAVCSGSTFSSGAITSTGIDYNWSRAAVANINGGAANTGGTNIPIGTGFSEVLTNSSTSPINVTYVLTPRSSSSTCTGIPYNLVITVNPSTAVPILGAITQPNCVVPTGSVPLSGLPAGAWTITRSGTSAATITGTGSATTISSLAAGTYFFSVSNGTCTSALSQAVVIDPVVTTTFNGTNWSSPPTILKLGVITASSTMPISLSSNTELCNCTVSANTNVVVNTGISLKLQDRLTVNGSLTFRDDASLVQANDVANSGNIIYERETTPIKRFDYTYWSSPVLNQKLIDVSPETDYDKFYSFDATIDNWKTEDPEGFMQRGIGYIIRAPEGTNAPPSPLSTYPASFIGVPFNGAFTIPGIIQDRSYLLGNPYPSALDADKFLLANSSVLDGTLYFWTHTTNIGIGVSNPGSGVYAYSSDDYATYNLTGGVGTAGNFIGTVEQTINRPTGKIAAGQAFFMSSQVSVPINSNIVFNNNMRLDVNDAIMDNSQFFKVNNSTKKTNTIEKHRVWLNLTNKQGAFKQMLVGYLTGATNGYDSFFDGPSYNGNEFIDFYSISDSEFLAIQGRALPFDENDSVPLGYSSAIEGDFSISIDEVDGLLVAQSIYLEDKLNNTIHNLTKEAYTFETSKGTFDDRFVLRYTDKTLGTGDFDTINMQVLISVKNKQIKINSSVESIDKVLIFDILGKQIFSKINVGATELVIPNLGSSEQVLIIKTLLQNGQTVTTKLIY
jgi:hypothetical protein